MLEFLLQNLGVTNLRGQRHAVASWDPPLSGSDPVVEQRFRTVYREFLRLESMAKETTAPLYNGVYGDDNNWTNILKKQKDPENIQDNKEE